MTSATMMQEIKDLFAKYGSGDYTPTPDEKDTIDAHLADMFEAYNKPTNEQGEFIAVLRPEGDLLFLDFKQRIGGLRMTRDQAITLADEVMKWVDSH